MLRKVAFGVSALIVLLFAWYYFVLRGFPLSLGYLNGVVAFSATIILGLSLFFGPLSRFFPKVGKVLMLRKDLGLIGYGLAALHMLLVIPLFIPASTETVAMGEVISIAVAALAFMIFTLMALTSTTRWETVLGFENWKNLQRVGYLAILLVLGHIVLLDHGAFLVRITGQIALGFGLLVLLLRGLDALVHRKK